MLIGDRLSELRKDRGLTQDQMAKELNMKPRTYGSYERNESEANDETKIKIARYFNISLDYLMGLTREMRPLTENTQYLKLPDNFNEQSRTELIRYMKYLKETQRS